MADRDGWQGVTGISRRRVLQMMAGAGAFVLRPRLLGAGTAPALPASSAGFLGSDEVAILDALTSMLIPSDELPGAREIGVVDYVQSLLSFMPGSDANCDRRVDAADVVAVELKTAGQLESCSNGGDVDGDGIVDRGDVDASPAAAFRARPMFGGGPFSGRNSQPHFPVGGTPCNVCHGANGEMEVGATATTSGAPTVLLTPPPSFGTFLPLNRLQRISWDLRILGKDAVPEVADNPLLDELPDVDLRRRYRTGLAALDSAAQADFGAPFVSLTAAQQREVFDDAPALFKELVRKHVIEGIFCAPEYGGNRDLLGWQMTGFDGDSQPLGYEIYDESAPGSYRERPDKPNSTPNPDETCAGFSPAVNDFLDFISSAADGGRFAEPFCFDVEA